MNRKLIAAVGVCAVVALSACGSSTDTRSPAKAGASASSQSAPAATADKPSSQQPPAGGTIDGEVLAAKVVDAMIAKKTAHASLAIAGAPAGAGQYEFSSPPKVAMKMSQQGVDLQIVQVGGITYIKGIPGTKKPWFTFDPKGTDAFSKLMASMVDSSKSNDPRALISMMNGVKGRDLGTEHVDGAPTHHYVFEVPLSAYGRVLSPQLLSVMKGMMKGLIVMAYWVDDEFLPRKLSTVMTLSGNEQETVITYSDWGNPVTIVAPPAAQVGGPPSL